MLAVEVAAPARINLRRRPVLALDVGTQRGRHLIALIFAVLILHVRHLTLARGQLVLGRLAPRVRLEADRRLLLGHLVALQRGDHRGAPAGARLEHRAKGAHLLRDAAWR